MTSESGGSVVGLSTTATYVRMIRPASCLHDVECTTTGVRGYHLITSSTTSAGVAEGGSPTRSESACIGFIQKRAPLLRPIGRTSSVCAVNCGDHGWEEMGGPIVSIRDASDGLALRPIVLDDAPDGAHLSRGDLLLVGRAPVLLDLRDDLRPRTASGPSAPAGDLHQHAKRLHKEGVPCRPWRSLKTSRSRPS